MAKMVIECVLVSALSCTPAMLIRRRSVAQNEMAKMVIERVPSIEMVRFVNSGTEACLSVLRLMRAYTGREKVRSSGHAQGVGLLNEGADEP